MNNQTPDNNLLFQSEQHPLVPLDYPDERAYCLGLIHQKAYRRAAGMAAGCDVLDLGCNNGYGTRIVAESARTIVGVDVSSRAIQSARESDGPADIRFELIDGLSLPFEKHSFDLVTSFQVIEHVEDVDPYLAEIVRVLRPGGTVVFTTPNACIRIDPGMKPWNEFHVREYTSDELRTQLSGRFSEIAIEGLFATPELYDVEFRRAQKALRGARRRRRFPRRQLIALRKSPPVQALKRMTARRQPVPEPEQGAEPGTVDRSFLTKWSLDDLFYRTDGLEAALDLIAVCRAPRA